MKQILEKKNILTGNREINGSGFKRSILEPLAIPRMEVDEEVVI